MRVECGRSSTWRIAKPSCSAMRATARCVRAPDGVPGLARHGLGEPLDLGQVVVARLALEAELRCSRGAPPRASRRPRGPAGRARRAGRRGARAPAAAATGPGARTAARAARTQPSAARGRARSRGRPAATAARRRAGRRRSRPSASARLRRSARRGSRRPFSNEREQARRDADLPTEIVERQAAGRAQVPDPAPEGERVRGADRARLSASRSCAATT